MHSACACCSSIGPVHAIHALKLCMLFRQALVLCMLFVHCTCAYCSSHDYMHCYVPSEVVPVRCCCCFGAFLLLIPECMLQSIFGKTVMNGNEDKGAGSRFAARGRGMSDSESGEEHSEAEDAAELDAAELDAAVLEAAAEWSDDSLDDGTELQEVIPCLLIIVIIETYTQPAGIKDVRRKSVPSRQMLASFLHW